MHTSLISPQYAGHSSNHAQCISAYAARYTHRQTPHSIPATCALVSTPLVGCSYALVFLLIVGCNSNACQSLTAAAITAMIKINTVSPTPIRTGVNTNHQLQAITPNNLATTKINVRILKNPNPPFFSLFIIIPSFRCHTSPSTFHYHIQTTAAPSYPSSNHSLSRSCHSA